MGKVNFYPSSFETIILLKQFSLKMHPGDLSLAVRKYSSIVSDTVKIKDGNGVSFFPPKEENEKCRGCLYNVIDQSYTDLHAWEMVSSVPFKAVKYLRGALYYPSFSKQ